MEKVSAIRVLEAMGKPQEYLKEAVEMLVNKIKEEKAVKVQNVKIADLKKLDSGLFSTFAEIELECDDVLVIMSLIFKYLPAHVEIIKPERFNLGNFDISSVFNELIMKLHKYDELAKILSVERNILAKQVLELRNQHGQKSEMNLSLEQTDIPAETKTKKKPDKKSRKK
jgi:hypothetical protein